MSLDIDSILALFTDLSVINTVVAISIVVNPMKNLKRSIHLIHNRILWHWIHHFHLGQFGHDLMFDLFIVKVRTTDRRGWMGIAARDMRITIDFAR